MSTPTIAPPSNSQLQSPLARLPAEIKHLIFRHTFASPKPIIDAIPGRARSSNEAATTPSLSLAILQTCRRLYHEADRRQIYTQNTFRFTTADRVRDFFQTLGNEYSSCVHDIEIDARKVRSNHPEIAKEWLQYLAWGSGNWTGGTWRKTMDSLRVDAPGLKCLRLNFSSWPTIPMFRTVLWNLLRAMVLQAKGLERIVIVGASRGKAMARRDPWSPVHFVGGDDVGADDLVELMWATVGKAKNTQKVIRWERCDGKLYLEVVTTEHLRKQVDRSWTGPCTRKAYTDAWPENGS
ncbi:hypothetical protein P280DRAFT_496710, partial [Massarina eburnea CBS 473.64]